MNGGGIQRRHDLLTLAAIGVAAHIAADVVHEVLGHGIFCLLSGGRITLLTSVFFRNEPFSRLVAAAGPCANIVAGFAALIAFKRFSNWPLSARLFLLFTMAFNFFWAAGYFIYSGLANEGDWALVGRGLGYLSIYRVILVLLGVVSYFAVTRIIFRAAVALSPHDMTLLLLIPYLAAGVAACVAALFYQPDRSGALLGAFRESFLTNILLLAIMLLRRRVRIEASAAPGQSFAVTAG